MADPESKLYVARIKLDDPKLRRETLKHLRDRNGLERIGVRLWRWEAHDSGRVLAERDETGRVTVYGDACREEFGEEL